MTDLQELKERLVKFNKERDWLQHNHSKEILIAMMSEVGELADCYRWLTQEEVNKVHADPEKRVRIEEEIADIFIYLMNLCHMNKMDMLQIINNKISKNEQKFPVETSKGTNTNKIL